MDEIQAALAQWYESHKRELPWRSNPSPYHVWLSEVILQQTRVNQGLDYFNRFVERWPSLADLAQASEEEVLKMWQGLGYYSRARNLLKCAQQVMELYGGAFPADYDKLLNLKGIGNYTAAAIASIAFGLPHAVIDGNVYRVLARVYDVDTPINMNLGAKTFARLAETLLDKEHPGRHNQAMMEFGALLCTPRHPQCDTCPIQSHCLAFAHGTIEQRPQIERNKKTRTRYFYYLVFSDLNKNTILHKREDNDIWRNLYDFPNIESDSPLSVEAITDNECFKTLIGQNDYVIQHLSTPFTHKLSHQTIIATFIEIKILGFLSIIQTNNLLLTAEKKLDDYPTHKLIENYISRN